MKEKLLEKIKERKLKVGIIGLGYVGLPLAVEKAKAGFLTIGFDVQKNKTRQVNRAENYIGDVVPQELAEVVKSGMLCATDDFSQISQVDFIAVCVPTPLDKHQQPDLSYIEASAKQIAKYMKKGTVVVLESTTYPGTTQELVKPLLEQNGFKCGTDFYLGYSPERVDPGNRIYKIKNTPRVVGAIGKDAAEVIAQMYKTVLEAEVAVLSSPAAAEMEKLLENTYRNVNISLINEFAMLCHKMGINVWEVIEAAKSKPYGFQAFYPGPGIGGHCIPLDPYYLSWKAREYGFHTTMIESAMTVNDKMPEYCVSRVADMLNQKTKSIQNSKILLLGVAYKQDVSDYRESPALKIWQLLEKKGAAVEYYDPWVPNVRVNGEIKISRPMLTADMIKEYDAVIVSTAHTNVDYSLAAKNARAIFDCKNALKCITERENVEVL
ncbi:MAG: nucleotide sugar dehydrogenase [Oscillospiraceae bacterium]|nr:nucleotide sugar dehydrogenase [Oscillospiraceae bacterium]